MNITSTKNFGVDKLKMLVYGISGAGKTMLAATLNLPTIIISAEAGCLSLAGKDIDVIDITRDDNGNLIPKEKRIAKIGEVYKWLLTPECMAKYKVVFIDSLSEMANNMLEMLQMEYPDKKETLQMYGENSKRMRSLIKSFRDLPNYSVIFTALAEKDKDEDNRVFLNIAMVGSVAKTLPSFLDEVFYLMVDAEGNRSLITSATDRLVCKDRSGKLNKIEPADLGAIFNKIKGE
jgi:phage nucleotide-binding protein